MNYKEINTEGVGHFINLDKFGLSTFSLKIIAIITMIIDHFAYIFCANYHQLYIVLRAIGRISFPIFCFILVEGYFHTRNKLKHGILLGIFALISEVPYDIMNSGKLTLANQNVMFSLFIGFMVIWILDSIAMFKVNYPSSLLKHIGIGRLNTILELVTMILGFVIAYFLNVSYSFAGILLIICFYVFRTRHVGKIVSNIVFNMGMFGFTLQWWGTLSALPIAFYNGKPGIKKGKYFFYWFYPLHITLLLLIRLLQIKYLR